MALVGQRYESGDYYLSELIMAGEIFKQVVARMPLGTPTESGALQGKIVFGTVKGDIHTIGKDLVVGLLRTC
jgi:5-methyltetrahydrofolate--homocysteine methyltransferase